MARLVIVMPVAPRKAEWSGSQGGPHSSRAPVAIFSSTLNRRTVDSDKRELGGGEASADHDEHHEEG